MGHKGKFGHEFLEFEIKGKDGRLRYTNNSQYKTENLIRKEGKCFLWLTGICLVYVNKIVIDELCRIIEDSRILTKSDREWPEPSKIGK